MTGLLASQLGACENVTQTGIFADVIPSCLFFWLFGWVGFLVWFGFWVLVVFCNVGNSNVEQNTQVTFPSSYWGISE